MTGRSHEVRFPFLLLGLALALVLVAPAWTYEHGANVWANPDLFAVGTALVSAIGLGSLRLLAPTSRAKRLVGKSQYGSIVAELQSPEFDARLALAIEVYAGIPSDGAGRSVTYLRTFGASPHSPLQGLEVHRTILVAEGVQPLVNQAARLRDASESSNPDAALQFLADATERLFSHQRAKQATYGPNAFAAGDDVSDVQELASQISALHHGTEAIVRQIEHHMAQMEQDRDGVVAGVLDEFRRPYPPTVSDAKNVLKYRSDGIRELAVQIRDVAVLISRVKRLKPILSGREGDWSGEPRFAPRSKGDISNAIHRLGKEVHLWERAAHGAERLRCVHRDTADALRAVANRQPGSNVVAPAWPNPGSTASQLPAALDALDRRLDHSLGAAAQTWCLETKPGFSPWALPATTQHPVPDRPFGLIMQAGLAQAQQLITSEYRQAVADTQRLERSIRPLLDPLVSLGVLLPEVQSQLAQTAPSVPEGGELDVTLARQLVLRDWWAAVAENLGYVLAEAPDLNAAWTAEESKSAPPGAGLPQFDIGRLSPIYLGDTGPIAAHWVSGVRTALTKRDEWLSLRAQCAATLPEQRDPVAAGLLTKTPYHELRNSFGPDDANEVLDRSIKALENLQVTLRRGRDVAARVEDVERELANLEAPQVSFRAPPIFSEELDSISPAAFDAHNSALDAWAYCAHAFAMLMGKWHEHQLAAGAANEANEDEGWPKLPALGVVDVDFFGNAVSADACVSKWQADFDELDCLVATYGALGERYRNAKTRWSEARIPSPEVAARSELSAPDQEGIWGIKNVVHRAQPRVDLAEAWADVHAAVRGIEGAVTELQELSVLEAPVRVQMGLPIPRVGQTELEAIDVARRWCQEAASLVAALQELRGTGLEFAEQLAAIRDDDPWYPSPPALYVEAGPAPDTLASRLSTQRVVLQQWQGAAEVWASVREAVTELEGVVNRAQELPFATWAGAPNPQAAFADVLGTSLGWQEAADTFSVLRTDTRSLAATLRKNLAETQASLPSVDAIQSHGWNVPPMPVLQLSDTVPPADSVANWVVSGQEWRQHVERLEALAEAQRSVLELTREVEARGHVVRAAIEVTLENEVGPALASRAQHCHAALERAETVKTLLTEALTFDGEFEATALPGDTTVQAEVPFWRREIVQHPGFTWEPGEQVAVARAKFTEASGKWRANAQQAIGAKTMEGTARTTLAEAELLVPAASEGEWCPNSPSEVLGPIIDSLSAQGDLDGLTVIAAGVGSVQADLGAAIKRHRTAVDVIEEAHSAHSQLLSSRPEAYRWHKAMEAILAAPRTSLNAVEGVAVQSRELVEDLGAALEEEAAGMGVLDQLERTARILKCENPGEATRDNIREAFLNMDRMDLQLNHSRATTALDELMKREAGLLQQHRHHATAFARTLLDLTTAGLPSSMAAILSTAAQDVLGSLDVGSDNRTKLAFYIESVEAAEAKLTDVVHLFRVEMRAFKNSAQSLREDQDADRRDIMIMIGRYAQHLEKFEFSDATTLRGAVMDVLTRAIFPDEISERDVFSLAREIYEKFEVKQ